MPARIDLACCSARVGAAMMLRGGREGGGRLDHDGCCSVGVLAGYDNLDFLLGTEIKDACISLEEQGCLRELLWGIGVLICKHSVL